MKVTEKKLADGVIKLDCEATAIEVNNALKEAAEAFAMQMGVRPAPGKSIEELVMDGMRNKITMINEESQAKLQDSMQKIVNDSNGGLVCIII